MMPYRVTVWTEYKQIIWRMVDAIKIGMMYAKYLWMRVKSTISAFLIESIFADQLSHYSVIMERGFVFWFSAIGGSANMSAEFSSFRTCKVLSAIRADMRGMLWAIFEPKRAMAFVRTVFSFCPRMARIRNHVIAPSTCKGSSYLFLQRLSELCGATMRTEGRSLNFAGTDVILLVAHRTSFIYALFP